MPNHSTMLLLIMEGRAETSVPLLVRLPHCYRACPHKQLKHVNWLRICAGHVQYLLSFVCLLPADLILSCCYTIISLHDITRSASPSASAEQLGKP